LHSFGFISFLFCRFDWIFIFLTIIATKTSLSVSGRRWICR